MKILQINGTYNEGSTGKIMVDINDALEKSGHSGFMVACYGNKNDLPENVLLTERLPSKWEQRKNILISRMTGVMGYRSKRDTAAILHTIDSFDPDIIHLHNIHGDWLNMSMLTNYLKERNKPVVWTLHDCWAFTGRCSHFELYNCDEWKTGCKRRCHNCVYPETYFFDWSTKMWEDKKKWFSGIPHLTIVTPSKWLANYVSDSFLGYANIQVIHNGIDLSRYYRSSSRSKYTPNVGNKKIILGVANSWGKRKGFDDFIRLNELINKEKYQIIMVGLNGKQLKSIPGDIIGIERTNNMDELVELYSQADIFINPTYEDNYPTTNLEAMACGTQVITYRTGGSIESMPNERYIVEQGNVDTLHKRIVDLIHNPIYTPFELRAFAEKKFDKYDLFHQYINIYENLYRSLQGGER